jgi:hypothetical protein
MRVLFSKLMFLIAINEQFSKLLRTVLFLAPSECKAKCLGQCPDPGLLTVFSSCGPSVCTLVGRMGTGRAA